MRDTISVYTLDVHDFAGGPLFGRVCKHIVWSVGIFMIRARWIIAFRESDTSYVVNFRHYLCDRVGRISYPVSAVI